MDHFDFRNRRSRFRRDVLSTTNGFGRNTGFNVSKSGQSFSLSFKSHPCVSNPPYLTPRRPLFVGACSACTVHSVATLANHELTSLLPLKNALTPISKLQLQSDLEDLAIADSPVNKAEMEAAILENGFVKSAIELSEVKENPISPLANFKEMNFDQQVVGKSKWDNLIRRVLKFIRIKILKIFFPNGIVYHSGQFDILTKVQRSGIPLLFVNLGESVFDVAIIQTVLSHHSIALSENTVIALEKNDFWSPFRKLLFGILTSFEMHSNVFSNISWAVQQTVFQTLIGRGHYVLLSPNQIYASASDQQVLDALGHAVELLSGNLVLDVQVVPVSTNYDQTFEELIDRSNLSFWMMFKIWLGLEPGRGQGSARVDIDQPFSLKEFVEIWSKKNDNTENNTQILLDHIKWNVSNLRRFSSVELLMFLFAYKFADSNDVTLSELENSFEELRQDLFERKKRDFKFSGSSKNVLNHAIDLLHPYLEKSDAGIVSIISGPDSTTLFREKSHKLVAVYVEDSVAAISVGSLVQIPLKSYIGTSKKVEIAEDKLSNRFNRLYSLLAREFSTVPPCEQLDKGFREGLDSLKLLEILSQDQGENQSEHSNERRSRQIAARLEMDGLDFSDSHVVIPQSILNLQPEAVKRLTYLQSLLQPTIYRYYQVVSALPALLENEFTEKNSFATSIEGQSLTEVLTVLYSLADQGIIIDNWDSVELAEQWKSKESLDTLICQVSKYLLF